MKMEMNVSNEIVSKIRDDFDKHYGIIRKVYDECGLVGFLTSCKINNNVFLTMTYGNKEFSKSHCKTKKDIETWKAISKAKVLSYGNENKLKKLIENYAGTDTTINRVFDTIKDVKKNIELCNKQLTTYRDSYGKMYVKDPAIIKFDRDLHTFFKLKNFLETITKYYDNDCHFYILEESSIKSK